VRRLGGLLLAVLLVAMVAGGLYYADGRIRERVERQVTTQLQTGLGTPTAPAVDIAGFPFLVEAALGSIKSVHIVADQLGSENDGPLPVRHADLVLTDVTSDDRFATMTAAHAEGTAELDYSALQSIAGVPLTYIGDGRVHTEATTDLLGQPVKAQIEGSPQVDVPGQTLMLDDVTITVAGVRLPDFTSKALVKAVLKPMPLTGIPFGLQVRGIRAEEDGVHAELTGDNLPIP
jgi:hypothetical protein